MGCAHSTTASDVVVQIGSPSVRSPLPLSARSPLPAGWPEPRVRANKKVESPQAACPSPTPPAPGSWSSSSLSSQDPAEEAQARPLPPDESAVRRLQSALRGYLVRREEAAAWHAAEERVTAMLAQEARTEGEREAAARRLQGYQRRHSEHRVAAALKRAELVARRLERESKGGDGGVGLEAVSVELPPDEAAARRLQSVLRGFIVRRDEAAAWRAAEERVSLLISLN